MTATINPRKGEPLLQRTNPDKRRADYEQALSFYVEFLGGGIDSILFVENSEADLESLKKRIPDNKKDCVEFLSFYGLDYPVEHGRGYGEFKLVDYAMENSSTINKAEQNDKILKITGRYRITNFAKVLVSMPVNFQLYCNHRNYPIRWVDMFFMSFTKEFYATYFHNLYLRFKLDHNNVAPEVSLRIYLDGISRKINMTPRYSVIPKIEAAKGMNNQQYQGFANKGKFMFRVVANKLFPWWWV